MNIEEQVGFSKMKMMIEGGGGMRIQVKEQHKQKHGSVKRMLAPV